MPAVRSKCQASFPRSAFALSRDGSGQIHLLSPQPRFQHDCPRFPSSPRKALITIPSAMHTHSWAVRSTFITITVKQAVGPNEAGCCLNNQGRGGVSILCSSRCVRMCVCVCVGMCFCMMNARQTCWLSLSLTTGPKTQEIGKR